MLKTIIRTTACLAVSATAFIVITKMDATAAKPRSPSVPEASEPKPAPSKPAPADRRAQVDRGDPEGAAARRGRDPASTKKNDDDSTGDAAQLEGQAPVGGAPRGAQAGPQRHGRRRIRRDGAGRHGGHLSGAPPAHRRARRSSPARRPVRACARSSTRRPATSGAAPWMTRSASISLTRPLLFVALAALAFLPLEHLAAAHARRRRRFATDLVFATVGQVLVRVGLVFAAGLVLARLDAVALDRPLLAAIGDRRARFVADIAVGLAAVRARRLRVPPAGARGARAVAPARDSPFVRDDGLAGVVPAAPAGDPPGDAGAERAARAARRPAGRARDRARRAEARDGVRAFERARADRTAALRRRHAALSSPPPPARRRGRELRRRSCPSSTSLFGSYSDETDRTLRRRPQAARQLRRPAAGAVSTVRLNRGGLRDRERVGDQGRLALERVGVGRQAIRLVRQHLEPGGDLVPLVLVHPVIAARAPRGAAGPAPSSSGAAARRSSPSRAREGSPAPPRGGVRW